MSSYTDSRASSQETDWRWASDLDSNSTCSRYSPIPSRSDEAELVTAPPTNTNTNAREVYFALMRESEEAVYPAENRTDFIDQPDEDMFPAEFWIDLTKEPNENASVVEHWMDLMDGPHQDVSATQVWIDLTKIPNEDLPPSLESLPAGVAHGDDGRSHLPAEGIAGVVDELSEDRYASPETPDPLYYIWISHVTLENGRSCSWSKEAGGWVADDATVLYKENFDGLTNFTVHARRSLDSAILRMRYRGQDSQWRAKCPEGSQILLPNWMVGCMLHQKSRAGVAELTTGLILVGVSFDWREFED